MIKTFLVLLAWAATVTSGFWFFSGKFFVPVARPAGSAQPEEIIGSHVASGGRVTVYNFWNPTCPCSRFMEDHVKSVVARFSPQGAEFIHVVEGVNELVPDYANRLRVSGEPTMMLDADGSIARKFGVWAAPAAVIVDQKGTVQFIGSYNVTRYCNDEKTAYAEQAIEKLLSNRRIEIQTVPFYGCSNVGN